MIEFYRADVYLVPDERDALDARDYCQFPRENRPYSVAISDQLTTTRPKCVTKRQPNNGESIDDWCIQQNIEYIRDVIYEYESEHDSTLSTLLNRRLYETECDASDDECRYEINESARFSRTIQKLLMPIEERVLEPIGLEKLIIDEDVQKSNNPNFQQRIFFDYNEYGGTITHLKPFTMYTIRFFACNKIGCSQYYMVNERTESSIYADVIDFEVSVDPQFLHTVHLDFSEPEMPNGLTVAFKIIINDFLTLKETEKCITRKQHYEKNKR